MAVAQRSTSPAIARGSGLVALVAVQHGQQQLLSQRPADVPSPPARSGRLLPPLARVGQGAVVMGVVAEVALRLEEQHRVPRGACRRQAELVVGRRGVAIGQQVVA